MAKATDKQIAYLNKLNEAAAPEDKIDSLDIMLAANDKFDGIKRVSAMIDQLKQAQGAQDAPPARGYPYTPQEAYPHERDRLVGPRPDWYATRNGPYRDELDNQ